MENEKFFKKIILEIGGKFYLLKQKLNTRKGRLFFIGFFCILIISILLYAFVWSIQSPLQRGKDALINDKESGIKILTLDADNYISSEYVAYGRDFAVEEELYQIEGSENSFYGFSKSKVTISKDNKVKIKEGVLLGVLGSEISLIIDDTEYSLPKKLIFVYDSTEKAIYIISGEILIGEEEVVFQNQKIVFYNNTYSISEYDRSTFNDIANWGKFIDVLSKFGQLVEELVDLTPPSLLINKPEELETFDEMLQISGKTEPEVKLWINDQKIETDNGAFLLEIKMELGVNKFNVIAKDNSGNITKEEFEVEYKDFCEGNNMCGVCGNPECRVHVIVPDNNPSCTFSDFNSQMLCLINDHRQTNGLETLSLDSTLSSVAQSHSNWMNSTSDLNHTGEGGSSPFDRCNSAGTSCSAENIAMNSNPSADNIFNQWKNSSLHNTNMLGNYSVIGIGRSGNYATTVFR